MEPALSHKFLRIQEPLIHPVPAPFIFYFTNTLPLLTGR